jgi:hypothetical protein
MTNSNVRKINLSGHFSPQLEEEGFFFPGALQLDTSLLEERGPSGVAKLVVDWLENNVPISPDCQVEIALPGFPLLRDIVIAWVHGRTGVFPITRCPRRQADGTFVFDPGLDLQDLRNTCRSNRPGVVRLG